LNNLISNLKNSFYLLCYIRIGVKTLQTRTLRTQDILAPSNWCISVGTVRQSTPVPKCLKDTLALVMNSHRPPATMPYRMKV